ncbi:uncharacterized protein BDZ83DRAFT_329158 [Colletotrichum acutatum]|uniref:Uncharacterized protein n=1 Tax=Glomerella acutata TaxID=27357 RepID=A0AAD8UN69_GLOAC|nr:uncharacterized protein BDZ83DRAFT_329158 [Colletotrichum acutatum]KAK1724643.1 hypothetical protein BDZ83DRAFT_329158 [Colletotrichum acutatum]
MRIASILLPLLSLLFRDCTGSTFYQPPGSGPAGDFRDNSQYTLGEIVDLQWETDDTSIDLYLVQTLPEDEVATILFVGESHTPLGWAWNVTFDSFPSWHSPDLSNVYYLHLQPSLPVGVIGAGVASHYFNITRSAASSVSSSASPSSSTLWTSVASPTTTPSATSTSELDRDELSTGAVAGIAVGATFVGTLFVVGLAGFLFLRRWGNNKKRGGEELGAIITANDGNEIHVYKRDVSEPSSELFVESTRRFGAEGSKPSEMRFEMSGDSVVRK